MTTEEREGGALPLANLRCVVKEEHLHQLSSSLPPTFHHPIIVMEPIEGSSWPELTGGLK